MEDLPKIPGYKIEKKIGEGATASVYLCIQEKLGRKVAVKVLRSGLINENVYIHRFIKEARIAAKLDHPGIVKIYDVKQTPNLSYIVMECLGKNLKDKLAGGKRLPEEEILRIIKQVASTLEYAHSNKVAHRDIKPANILFKQDGTPVLVDFGMALDEAPNVTRTILGGAEGTGFYMSPEQCKGKKGEYASDFYSLGVVLFEMLSGEVPYKADNFLEVVDLHKSCPIPRLPDRVRYQTLIDRLMEKDKEKRFKSGKEVIQMIDKLKTGVDIPGVKIIRKEIEYFCFSHSGRRPTNQDKALCEVSGRRGSDNRIILAVADGIGDLKEGDTASQTVYDVLIKLFQDGLSADLQQTSVKIETYIKAANRSIYDWSRQKKGVQVGTTVSGAVVIGNRCLVFNVGDSRTYIINAGGIKQLTVDHSADWQSFEDGIIKKEDIGKGWYSNALTRAVGTAPDVKVDIFPGLKLNKGDILFSCTDGLWNKVTDAEIKGVFDRNRDIKKVLETLYKLAYKKGSKGNISMAACRYGEYGVGPGAEAIEEVPTKEKPQRINYISKYLLIVLSGLFLGMGVSIFFVLIRVYFEDDSASKINVNVKTVRQVIPIKKDTPGKDISRGYIQGPVSLGGVIRFRPDSGELSKNNKIELSIAEPLKSKRGEVIPADIYYTLDGSEPTKTNGTQYITGDPVDISKEGENTLKAKVISRVGKYEGTLYSRTYILRKSIDKKSAGKTPGNTQTPGTQTPIDKKPIDTPPVIKKDPTKTQPGKETPGETKIETVTNVDDLDQKNINGVLERIKEINVDLSGVEKVNKTGLLRIKISISQEGEARLVEIPDFAVEPAGKLKEIKSALDQKIRGIKFPPLTKKGKPVNAEIVTNFKKIIGKDGRYKLIE